MIQCPDCDSVKMFSAEPEGDGKCSVCHGTGYGGFLGRGRCPSPCLRLQEHVHLRWLGSFGKPGRESQPEDRHRDCAGGRTAPGHVNDTNAMTYVTPSANSSGRFSGDLQPLGVRIDASGGWWDAGDYIKGVETLSYATDLLLDGARDFPAQMGSGYAAEAKFGADWLLRMWDDATKTFYYQVGIGEGNAKTVGDHDIWRLPQEDDNYGGTDPSYRYIRNRPVFRLAPPGSLISPNLAGRDAAAFAMCFELFKKSCVAWRIFLSRSRFPILLPSVFMMMGR